MSIKFKDYILQYLHRLKCNKLLNIPELIQVYKSRFSRHFSIYILLAFIVIIFYEFNSIIAFFILDNDQMDTILISITIALLTLFVPLVIALFSEYYRAMNRSEDFAYLDMQVFLEDIFNIRLFLGYLLIAIFLPMLLWNKSNTICRFFEFCLAIAGILLVAGNIFAFYKWINGDKSRYRKIYFEGLVTSEKNLQVWDSLWKSKNIKKINEENYINIFMTKVEKNAIVVSCKYRVLTASQMLGEFNRYIEYRDPHNLLSVMLRKLLYIHFNTYRHYVLQSNNDKYMYMEELLATVDETIENIEKMILYTGKINVFLIYHFFNETNEAIKNNIDLMEKGGTNVLFREIIKNFFEWAQKFESQIDIQNILQNSHLNIWRVTEDNLKSKYNIPSRITLSAFLQWIEDNLRTAGNIYRETNITMEPDIDLITNNVFPDVEPFYWSYILLFVFLPYGSLKNFIEKPWPIGHIGRANAMRVNRQIREKEKDYVKNTFKLADLIFNKLVITDYIVGNWLPFHFPPPLFEVSKLYKYLNDLKSLKSEYSENTQEKAKLEELIRLFESFKEFMEQGGKYGNPEYRI